MKIKIPAGTQPGVLIRLSGRGVTRLRASGRGDHYVRIKVNVPQKLTNRQKELMEELKKEDSSDSNKKGRGWF